MTNVVAEQEDDLLISDRGHRLQLDDETVAQLVRKSGSYCESAARRPWRDLFEHVR